MANTLRRMERDGLVERRPCKGDKRARIVCLTDRARSLQGPATQTALAQNTAALAGLSAQEQDQLNDLMARVIATMRRL